MIPEEYKIADISQINLDFLTSLLSYLRKNKREDTWIEVKSTYGVEVDPDEIRKDFSCMANSGGGYFLIGVGDQPNFKVTGCDEIDFNRIRKILGDPNKMTAFPDFENKEVYSEDGKRVIIVYIKPVNGSSVICLKDKNKQHTIYVYYTRSYLRTDCQKLPCEMGIIYNSSEKLPESLQLDPEKTGFLNLDGAVSPIKTVEWSLDERIYDLKDNNGNLLFYKYNYLIPVPFFNLNNFKFFKYGYYERWNGELKDLPEILKEIESNFNSHYGIGFSYWTLTQINLGNAPFTNFISGVSPTDLSQNIANNKDIGGGLSAFWILSSGVHLAMVYLSLFDMKAELQLYFRYSKIPNNKLFPHIENNLVTMRPISLYELPELEPDFSHVDFSADLFLDNPSDDLLTNLIDYKLSGYLGGLRKKIASGPPLISNLAVLNSCGGSESRNPLNSFKTIIGRINSHGSLTNFKNPVKITGYRLNIITLPPFITVPIIPLVFELAIDLNQESKYRTGQER
ncbi:hypothetical protein [Thermoplasma acidophilum]|uniref:Schlafen AlbA-2 domain-containing protein n=1 Tax=Thermoplasma acidophilum (strain ATCC 25905 / DSM 1728 / JCM 9062 / NBRC 15155 / AMRC-C165) TaxID=273075 RepID=Q9HJY5_THEAC|nr:ATP-binding protein [Thermoplasma acidophilum]CAC11955.1 hypothetical protein [Thermoplasma acidophilum]